VILLSTLLGLLAVARLTRLIVEDRVAIALRQWVVRKWGEDSKPAYFIHCPWCTSLWISTPVMAVASLYPNRWVVAGLAILAGSMITGLLLDTWNRGE
jgi:hypothetical protein